MMLDNAIVYSRNQAITTTAVSTDVTDHGAAGVFNRQNARAVATIPVTFTGGTSIQAVFQTSAAENFASPVALITGPVVPVASAVAGSTLLDAPIPDGALRYTRMNYVVVGTMTAGQVDAGVVLDSPSNTIQTYPDAVTVY